MPSMHTWCLSVRPFMVACARAITTPRPVSAAPARAFWPLGLLLLSGLLLWTAPVWGQTCTRYASPNGTGDGLSQGSPYRITNFINGSPQPGDVLCLLDGTYTQDGIELGSTPSGAPGAPITVRALNDGGAFLDGQHTHRVLFFNGTSYWTIQGIDFGNTGGTDDSIINLYPDTHHITLQRVCAWNATTPVAGVYTNSSTFGFWNAHDNLFEDVCAFGWGRNTFVDFEANTKNNVLRRIWLRWDGYPDGAGATCPGPVIQAQYYTAYSNDVHDNWISIFSGGLYKTLYSGPSDPNHTDGFPCANSLGAGWVSRAGMADQSQGQHWNGFINYGYPDNNDILADNAGIGLQNRWAPIYFQDVFSDARFGRTGHMNINLYGCDYANAEHYDIAVGSDCSLFHADRLTSIRNADQPASVLVAGTNFNDCTSLGACPNFYTGVGPGTPGSRACFEYQNGALTSTPLWPWRMDDRIKQALARSGIGPPLQGSAGSGYAANTVTSEIVSRYGAIPAACLRGDGSPPPPVVSCPTGGGICAWWKFEEGTLTAAADTTGNGHTLNLTAGPTWQSGKIGSFGLHCDGTGGYAEQAVAFGDPLYTWTGWVKGDTDPSTTVTTAVVVNGNDTLPWGFAWGQVDANFRQAWFQRDAGGAYHAAKLTTPLVANTWYHVAGTYDGTNIRAYLNGQLQATTATGSAIATSGSLTFCGIRATTSWAGTVDEVRVWARALSDAEVAAEYVRAAKRVGHKRLTQ